MKKTSYILKAFNIIGPEEILNLAEVSGGVSQLKMVSGDSLLWDQHHSSPPADEPAAKIIPFPKNKTHFQPLAPPDLTTEEMETQENEMPHFTTGEMALVQREISKEAESTMQRMSAHGGYRKCNEMFLIKSKSVEGKLTTRFAATHGVLVDKKQA